MELLHEFNLATDKQLTPVQLSNLAVRVFGQPGQLDVCPEQVDEVREEYRRWCHPVKLAQLVNDLTKYYNGEPIGRHGRKKRQADAEDSSDEAEEIAADASVILGPAE